MALDTQSTQEISDALVAQIAASIGQAVPILPKAFVRVLAKVFAGVVVLVYKYAGFIFLQLFVAHATMEETIINGKPVRPLVAWGRLLGAGDPELATRAELVVTVPVQVQVDTIKAGAQLVRSDTGVIYTVVADVALDAASVPVTIRAVSDQQGGDGSGTIGNLAVGDKLEFANPLPNVAREVTVASVTEPGVDAETADAYRLRIIKRVQRRPQGGAYADYQLWGEEVPGIVNVYPYAGPPGIVEIFVEASEASSGSADGIPTTPQLDAVKAAIYLDVAGVATRKPVNVALDVKAITRVAFNVIITGLDPSSPETRVAMEDGVREYLLDREPFIEGLSVLPRKDRVTQTAIGGIVEDIASAAGATVTTVTLSPGPATTLGHGQKAKLGDIEIS